MPTTPDTQHPGDEAVNPTVFYVDGAGPLTQAQVLARRKPTTEARWRHFKRLEATVGSLHTEDGGRS